MENQENEPNDSQAQTQAQAQITEKEPKNALPLYKPNAACHKCGYTSARTLYRPHLTSLDATHIIKAVKANTRDFLERTYERCSYQWAEKTIESSNERG